MFHPAAIRWSAAGSGASTASASSTWPRRRCSRSSSAAARRASMPSTRSTGRSCSRRCCTRRPCGSSTEEQFAFANADAIARRARRFGVPAARRTVDALGPTRGRRRRRGAARGASRCSREARAPASAAARRTVTSRFSSGPVVDADEPAGRVGCRLELAAANTRCGPATSRRARAAADANLEAGAGAYEDDRDRRLRGALGGSSVSGIRGGARGTAGRRVQRHAARSAGPSARRRSGCARNEPIG